MKKSFFNKYNPWKLFLLMKKTRAKKFKVRMFYHLQNLFRGGFVRGVLAWGFCRGVYVRGVFCTDTSKTFEVGKLPGDLALASGEKLTNHKHSDAQRSPDIFHNDS